MTCGGSDRSDMSAKSLAGHDRNAHGLEVAGRDDVAERGFLLRRGLGAAFEREAAHRQAVDVERHRVGERRRLHRRHALQSIEQLRGKLTRVFVRRRACRSDRRWRAAVLRPGSPGSVSCVSTKLSKNRPATTSTSSARPHCSAISASRIDAPARRFRSAAQRLLRIDAPELQRRRRAEEQAAADAEDRGERQARGHRDWSET